MLSRIVLFVILGLAIFCYPAELVSKDPPKCSLSGRITNASGRIFTVKLRRVDENPLAIYDGYSTQSAPDGTFYFADIEPGRYVLQAEGLGFMPADYGAQGPGQSGTPIELKPGQHRTNLAISLAPKHVVCGRVTDEQGRPVQRATVGAFARHKGSNWISLDDLRTMEVNTDDEGNYLLPNLPPGQYFIQAVPYTWYFGARNITQGESESLANAEPVEVGPEDTKECRENIRVGPRTGWHGFHVRGKIADDPALIGSDLVLSLMEVNPTGAAETSRRGGETETFNPPHTFDIWGVPAGHFRLILSKGRFPPNGSAGQPAFTILSSQEITVSDKDVNGISVALDPLASLAGQLKLENLTVEKACPTREKTHLRIQKEDDGEFQNLEVTAGGTFLFQQVPLGTYDIQLHPFLRGAAYVKSMLFDGQPVEGRRLRISSATSHSLQLIVSGDAAHASGHIAPEEFLERYQAEGTHPKASVSGKVKNALPDAPWVKLWAVRFNSDRSYEYSTKPQPDGSFRFDNVDPGIYLLLTQGRGYALSEYGAPYPGLEGKSLTLKAGQHLEGLELNAARKEPSLCGRVTDENGKPLPNVSVLASISPRYATGLGRTVGTDNNPEATQSAASVGVVGLGPTQVLTDSAGDFRFFNLRPGQYFLWTDFLLPSGQAWTRHWTYFPSSPNLDGAQPIHVGFGPDTGCPHNIQMQIPRAFHVGGHVPKDLAHAEGENFALDLVETNAAGVEGLIQTNNMLDPGAAFDFSNVNPGHYRFRLRGPFTKPQEGFPIEWSGPCPFPNRTVAFRELVVRDGDLNNVTLEQISTASVTGELQFEHIPDEWRGLRADAQTVTLSPTDELYGQQGAGVLGSSCSHRIRVSSDGKFTLEKLPGGTYQIGLELMGVQGDELYLKAIALNGMPVEGRQIILNPGQSAKLTLVVSNDGGEIDVKVKPSGPPAEEYRYDQPCRPNMPVAPRVVLIPETIPPDGSGIVTGWLTTSGLVEVPRVPPGRYFALASENFNLHFASSPFANSPWTDRKFLQLAKALGAPVGVAAGQKITLSLPSLTAQIQDLLAKYEEDVSIWDHCAASCSYDGFWNGEETAQTEKP